MAASIRQLIAQAFRPTGPKVIQTGIAWVNGGQTQINNQVDLSLPIKGIRLVFQGRVVIGGADMASVNPEGFANLISEVVISGTNARQQGNVTLYDTDLATQFVLPFLTGAKTKNFYALSVGGAALTKVGEPGTPFPTGTVASGAWIAVTQATYDFRIQVDFPFHPFESDGFCKAPLSIPGFLVRNEEWKDSVSIRLRFPTVAGGAVAGPLGTGQAATTLTLTAFGSGAGSPTIDLYSLPMEMGLSLKDQVIPGVLSRVQQPITNVLQAAGGVNTVLANLQKQPTPRIYLKVGVSTVNPAMSALSDANVTTLGVLLGANRVIRNNVDIFAHKADQNDYYDSSFIQGYTMMDFIQSGNPLSAFAGQDIGDGAQFQLVGTVAGVANALGLVTQEQILQLPAGPMYES